VISKEEVLERARSWGLRPDVVEKDYVLGWLLAALARHPEVRAQWVFKGGTCLKKCYFETYRFSEDLDFSLRATAVYTRDGLRAVLREVASSANELSGIVFALEEIQVDDRHNKAQEPTFQARVPYRGPLGRPQFAKVLFDLSRYEVLVDEADQRAPFHAYPDELPEDVAIPAYSIEELVAEKTRALLERTRPRDLYDVVQIVENHAEGVDFSLAREFFHAKCTHKGLVPPTAHDLVARVVGSQELRADWANMLAHQLPALPPIDGVLSRVSEVLAWLDAAASPGGDEPAAVGPVTAPLQRAPAGPGAGTLLAPPTTTYWGQLPLEQVRFAGANRLLIAFEYNGKARLAEPYSLRRAAAGHVTLFAWEQGAAHIKQFRVDELRGLTVTPQSFVPRFVIELTGSMIPSRPAHGRLRRRHGSSLHRYVYRCTHCGREFAHERSNASLRPHQDSHGHACAGRRGFLERVEPA
jgi:predicted nucleotidyltransferase component of viral defense system